MFTDSPFSIEETDHVPSPDAGPHGTSFRRYRGGLSPWPTTGGRYYLVDPFWPLAGHAGPALREPPGRICRGGHVLRRARCPGRQVYRLPVRTACLPQG